MPKKTFLNLSSDKQQNIIFVALKEFASHDYESASINRIINELGIAKGSFYRYFESKKHLYKYLIDITSNHRLTYIKNHVSLKEQNIFSIYKKIFKTVLEYYMLYPIQNIFLYNSLYENSQNSALPFKEFKKIYLFFSDIIINAQNTGQFKKEIEPEFLLFCIVQLATSIEMYIRFKLGKPYIEVLQNGGKEFKIYKKELQKLCDEVFDMLMFGLQP